MSQPKLPDRDRNTRDKRLTDYEKRGEDLSNLNRLLQQLQKPKPSSDAGGKK